MHTRLITRRGRPAVAAAAGVLALAPPGVPAHAATGIPATVETPAVSTSGDAADDMVIWAHPDTPAASVVIGTDRDASLEVYDMTGRRVQKLQDNPNNVDLRSGFVLDGRPVHLVGGADFDSGELRFWVLDAETRQLTGVSAGDGDVATKAQGFCMYRSAASGRTYAFGATTGGHVVQAELRDQGGKVAVEVVRRWDAGGHSEGCVADDDLGAFYVSEEDRGIWRYGAEPDDSTKERTLVDGTGRGGHLSGDVEGLAIVRQAGTTGYLIASSQGNDTFVVYRREAGNEYVRTFQVVEGTVADGCSHTDGIDALAADLGPAFSHGMFSCQDNDNSSPGPNGNQNFKFVPLEAAVRLEGAPGPR